MKPPVETIRLTKQARDNLITLKRRTKLPSLNILCRWALFVSLTDKTPPQAPSNSNDGGFDIAWQVFAGDRSTEINGLLSLYASKNITNHQDPDLMRELRAHIHRGLAYLTSEKRILSIYDLILEATSGIKTK